MNFHKFEVLLYNDIVPVLALQTHDNKGMILNTNADTVSSVVTSALAKHYEIRLIYCFEKKGVQYHQDNENSVIHLLPKKLVEKFKQSGIIINGMVPKLQNGFAALKSGVREVFVTNAGSILNIEEGTQLGL